MKSWQDGVAELAARGLNVIASSLVRELPREILENFQEQKIPIHEGDSIVVVGHGGRALWSELSQQLDGEHPVDSYSLRQIETFTREVLGEERPRVLYPRAPYLVPLQKLGRALNLGRPSWLGLDVNDVFGPWFAFRAVFLTSQKIPQYKPADFASPCESCVSRDCRSACPVTATGETFHLAACAGHRLSEGSPCRYRCLARQACPVGREHRYSDEQMQYHMGRPAHLLKLGDFK